MTKEEILAMKPSKELDAQAAKLLGKPVYKNREGRWLIRTGSKSLDRAPLPYSTDISAAWQVVEKLTEDWKLKGKPISIEVIYDCGAYETKIETWNEKKPDWNEPIFSSSCREAPEAICKAALLTKLAEIKRLEEE